MYTPNKENYIQEMRVKTGMDQIIPYDKIKFDLGVMKSYEMYQVYHSYYPLVLSVNYQKNGRLYAFINYAHFTKDSNGGINGAHITKQVILVSYY